MSDDTEHHGQHSPEPWSITPPDPSFGGSRAFFEIHAGTSFVCTVYGYPLRGTAKDNAERIAACVNFCRPFSTKDLNKMMETSSTHVPIRDAIDRIVAELDSTPDEKLF